MKRLFLISMMTMFLFGCGQAARESGFYTHDSMYKDWDHFVFSTVGYKYVTAKDAKESKVDEWWGIPEEYTPTK
jgi:hypothetical protein